MLQLTSIIMDSMKFFEEDLIEKISSAQIRYVEADFEKYKSDINILKDLLRKGYLKNQWDFKNVRLSTLSVSDIFHRSSSHSPNHSDSSSVFIDSSQQGTSSAETSQSLPSISNSSDCLPVNSDELNSPSHASVEEESPLPSMSGMSKDFKSELSSHPEERDEKSVGVVSLGGRSSHSEHKTEESFSWKDSNDSFFYKITLARDLIKTKSCPNIHLFKGVISYQPDERDKKSLRIESASEGSSRSEHKVEEETFSWKDDNDSFFDKTADPRDFLKMKSCPNVCFFKSELSFRQEEQEKQSVGDESICERPSHSEHKVEEETFSWKEDNDSFMEEASRKKSSEAFMTDGVLADVMVVVNTDSVDALASEVARKHDELRVLNKQIMCLEEDIQKSFQKIQLKDDVIKELRAELKSSIQNERDKSYKTLEFIRNQLVEIASARMAEHYEFIESVDQMSEPDPDSVLVRNVRQNVLETNKFILQQSDEVYALRLKNAELEAQLNAEKELSQKADKCLREVCEFFQTTGNEGLDYSKIYVPGNEMNPIVGALNRYKKDCKYEALAFKVKLSEAQFKVVELENERRAMEAIHERASLYNVDRRDSHILSINSAMEPIPDDSVEDFKQVNSSDTTVASNTEAIDPIPDDSVSSSELEERQHGLENTLKQKSAMVAVSFVALFVNEAWHWLATR